MRRWRIPGKWITAVVATAMVVLAMLWMAGTFRSGRIEPAKVGSAAQAAPGATFTVTRVKRLQQAEVVGSIQSERRTTVAPRLTAVIGEMPVRAGELVRKGDLLAVLDDRDLRARVAQAQESLRAAEAMHDLAQIEVNRLAPMVRQNVASEYELDQWRMKLAAASADVVRAQQAIKEAEVALSDTRLLAPFDGVVVDRQAEPGDLAAPGKPLLTLYDPEHLRIEASVRESYIGRLTLGQEMRVFIDALRQERGGVVDQIVPAADPGSRSFVVKVRLLDGSGLYPGMYGRIRVPLDEQEDLAIPAGAVASVGQLTFVQVRDQGGTQRRAVRLGQRLGEKVQVLAGLEAGEQVLVPVATDSGSSN